jgi:hypothetical protein
VTDNSQPAIDRWRGAEQGTRQTGGARRALIQTGMCRLKNFDKTLLLDGERMEIGQDRIDVLVGKIDLQHRPVFGNHALPEFGP